MSKINRLSILIIGICFILAVVSVGGFLFYKDTKKYNKDNMFSEKESVLPVEMIDKQDKIEFEPVNLDYELPEGAVIYNDKVYVYNEDIVNLLFIGVDAMEGGRSRDKTMLTGNMSDTLIVAVINTKLNTLHLINIPRDTLADINLLSFTGEYAGTTTEPIALAHAYGNSEEVSAELVVLAVRRLLYDIPIYRYLSLNITGVGAATDAVGGITLELLDDFSMVDKQMTKGKVMMLNGKRAIIYLSQRSLPGMEGENLGSRMPRQMQFFTEYFKVAKEKTKSNIMFPAKLLTQLDEYVTHNIDLNEISYLTQLMLLQDIDFNNIIVIDGEMTQEGYVVDEEKLYQLIIDLFYIPQEELTQ